MFDSIDDILLPGIVMALFIIVIVDVALASRTAEPATSQSTLQTQGFPPRE